MRLKLSVLLAVVCAVALALAGPAAAQNPSENAYAPSTCTACTGTSSGTLPFTGIDVGLLAVVGVSLAGVGLVMRRRIGSRTD
jgi:multisubunit Na+/H+ antiporter MnhB subunit